MQAVGLPEPVGPERVELIENLEELPGLVEERIAASDFHQSMAPEELLERELILYMVSEDAPRSWSEAIREARERATSEDKERVAEVLRACRRKRALERDSWGLDLLSEETPRQRLLHLVWLGGLLALQNQASVRGKEDVVVEIRPSPTTFGRRTGTLRIKGLPPPPAGAGIAGDDEEASPFRVRKE